MRIVILVLAVLAIILCLLQNDKNEGVLSLGAARPNNTKKEKIETNVKLEIATAVVVLGLFVSLFIEMM